MPILLRSEFTFGDMLIRYVAPAHEPEAVGLVILPAARRSALATPREHIDSPATRALPASWLPIRAWEVDPLVHVHVRGDARAGAFAQGRTLRAAPAASRLRQIGQETLAGEGRATIRTRLADGLGLECVHELTHVVGEPGLRVRTTARNVGSAPLTLELLTSFSLGGLTPFASDDAAGRLRAHRFRTTWSGEGRLDTASLEQLHLERSWIGWGVQCERFGCVGSMPANGWFPFAGVEDLVAGVTWAAQLVQPGSWQLELYRRADQLALSGGMADHELGHWCKTLAPGETLTSPEAWLTVTVGDIDAACARLVALQKPHTPPPAVERDLPVVFNEWCSSWGSPTHAGLVALADRLRGSGVRYLVIDDGWAERTGAGAQQNGDWIVNRAAFPAGLRATADAVRERGLVPGIWFEFEVVNEGSLAWHETAHQLHRDGRPLQVGGRRFWDFRDPWVHAFLAEKVTRLLREGGFGYLKVDYNDSIGLGCDDADSPGEGLRAHLDGVRRFFQELRAELPDLVIENCSSGGHRLEPSLMALASMSSFSDAHETPDIPIIAANLLRLVASTHLQIWAVLRATDSRQRLAYSLAATFLGRMCLSGEVHALDPAQWGLVREALDFYAELSPVIARARFTRFGRWAESYQHPSGAQAVLVHAPDLCRAFVVWHAFAEPPAELVILLPEGCGHAPARHFGDETCACEARSDRLILRLLRPWSGGVVALVRPGA